MISQLQNSTLSLKWFYYDNNYLPMSLDLALACPWEWGLGHIHSWPILIKEAPHRGCQSILTESFVSLHLNWLVLYSPGELRLPDIWEGLNRILRHGVEDRKTTSLQISSRHKLLNGSLSLLYWVKENRNSTFESAFWLNRVQSAWTILPGRGWYRPHFFLKSSLKESIPLVWFSF